MSKKVEVYIETLEPTFAEKVKMKAKVAGRKTVDFCARNSKEIVTLIPIALAVGKRVIKAVRPTQYERERKRIDHTYYDPRTGEHWELRRKATNKERLTLEERRAKGELTGKILKDMGLIK